MYLLSARDCTHARTHTHTHGTHTLPQPHSVSYTLLVTSQFQKYNNKIKRIKAFSSSSNHSIFLPSASGMRAGQTTAASQGGKLQALIYDILPLEEGAGKRCSERVKEDVHWTVFLPPSPALLTTEMAATAPG